MNTSATIRWRAAAATSAGCVRPLNEDSYLVDSDAGRFAVADGVGGLPYGERASRCAIESWAAGSEPGALSRAELTARLARCHHAVRALAARLRARPGIGTTFTAVSVDRAGHAWATHVGDSAAFLVSAADRRLARLTTPHVRASAVVRVNGDPGFRVPPRLERYLGQDAPPGADLHSFRVAPGDRLILCSDGVLERLEEDELAILSQAQATPADLAGVLIKVAELRGGFDNATAVVVDLVAG